MAPPSLAQLLSNSRDDTSELLYTVQRQARELADLRTRVAALETERESRADDKSMEAEAIADALNRSAAATEAREEAEFQLWLERRGAPGGRARAREARRHSDGTFASDIEVAEAEYEARLPFARAGTSRAAQARRDEQGRFLPNHLGGNDRRSR